jgi:hypothetical protein
MVIHGSESQSGRPGDAAGIPDGITVDIVGGPESEAKCA